MLPADPQTVPPSHPARTGSIAATAKPCRMSWNSVPRSAAPGSRSSGSTGCSRRISARIDRIRVAPQRLDLGDGKARRAPVDAAASVRAAWRTALLAARREAAPSASDSAPRARMARSAISAGAGHAAVAASARRRRAPRLRAPSGSGRASRCAIAMVKSCADWPIRRSGGSRSRPDFIMRDMKRSGSALRGQMPSFSPPMIIVSTLCRRASSGPQIDTRGSPRRRRLDRLAGDQRRQHVGPFVGRKGQRAVETGKATQEIGKAPARLAAIDGIEPAGFVARQALPAPRPSRAEPARGRLGRHRAARQSGLTAAAIRVAMSRRFAPALVPEASEPEGLREAVSCGSEPRSRNRRPSSRRPAARFRRAAPRDRWFRPRAARRRAGAKREAADA